MMVARHSLLQRQVKRYLDGVDTSAAHWQSFLESVQDAYRGFDSDRQMADRAMDLSSNELLEANAQLRAIVQAFPDQILQLDDDGVVITARGAEGGVLSGLGPVEGRHLSALLPPAVSPAFEEALRTAVTTPTVATIKFTDERAAQPAAYEVRLAALGGTGAIALLRDVTEQWYADEMRVARDAAEATSRARSNFLANMSHELRTPLNAVIGYSELISEDAAAAGWDTAVADLSRINSAGRHLLQIVNDLLDIAKADAGRLNCDIEVVEVGPLLEAVLADVRPLATAARNDLEMIVAPGVDSVLTDAMRLRQILLNLLRNACKFTNGGTVTLDVHPADLDDRSWIAFVVKDTGIGIPAQRIGQLFQDFVQLDDSSARQYGGTGLGLSLSRRLCDVLGGRIDVTSQPGVGSTFSVWIPCADAVDSKLLSSSTARSATLAL